MRAKAIIKFYEVMSSPWRALSKPDIQMLTGACLVSMHDTVRLATEIAFLYISASTLRGSHGQA